MTITLEQLQKLTKDWLEKEQALRKAEMKAADGTQLVLLAKHERDNAAVALAMGLGVGL